MEARRNTRGSICRTALAAACLLLMFVAAVVLSQSGMRLSLPTPLQSLV